MEIKKITEDIRDEALQFVWNVSLQYEVPDYSEEGVKSFHKSVLENKEYIENLDMYGAFIEGEVKGVIATRKKENHIALFFVDGNMHKQGIGKKLLEAVAANCTTNEITVHSSPYAVEVYRNMGFVQTSVEHIEGSVRYIPMKYIVFHEQEIEVIKEYPAKPKNKDGSIRWYLYRWDDGKDGYRFLARSRKTNQLYLVQKYMLVKLLNTPNTIFEDWYEVESERQADKWNRELTGPELERKYKANFKRKYIGKL